MDTYTIEVRAAILTGDSRIHTWVHITRPDGSTEAYGFYPENQDMSNYVYGAGSVQPENIFKEFSSTSGPMTMTEGQHIDLKNYIDRTTATPPYYSLPFGSHCTHWALRALYEAGLIPGILTPNMEVNGARMDFAETLIWNSITQPIWFNFYQAINPFFNAAYGWRQPRYDPLTLDLDGDGLETVGINPGNPILFDHDGDGIKTGTGWVKPDDGFLVLDRNGNGLIDSGREMFGDATPLAGGGVAADGFAALAQEDTNADGRVDSLDTRFTDLRIWRDLNQDGLSQAGELSTLAQAGIVAVLTAKTEHAAVLANGNQIADKGGYVRADGTEGDLVEVTGDLADIDLAENPFYSEFTGAITPVKEVQALPDFRSGQVWDGVTVIYKQAA